MQKPTRPQYSSLRVQAATSVANAPYSCPDCGSIFLKEHVMSMYTPSGSNFRGVSVTPAKIYECACGKLITPPGHATGISAGSERDLFVQSIKLAIDKREKSDPATLAAGTVSIAEHNRVKEQLEELTRRFNAYLGGEDVEPLEGEEFIQGESSEEQEPVASQPEEPVERIEIPLVPTGAHGRSAASALSQVKGDAKVVESDNRPHFVGGARSRMQRQGGETANE